MVTIRQRKLNLLPCKKQECQITPWNLKKEIWLAVYSRSNLIGVTYIHLSLTHSLAHWPVHNIPDVPTKVFFYKKITQKLDTIFTIFTFFFHIAFAIFPTGRVGVRITNCLPLFWSVFVFVCLPAGIFILIVVTDLFIRRVRNRVVRFIGIDIWRSVVHLWLERIQEASERLTSRLYAVESLNSRDIQAFFQVEWIWTRTSLSAIGKS